MQREDNVRVGEKKTHTVKKKKESPLQGWIRPIDRLQRGGDNGLVAARQTQGGGLRTRISGKRGKGRGYMVDTKGREIKPAAEQGVRILLSGRSRI